MTKIQRPENGDHVAPGEPLGVIEEFVPGQGTFEENGNIYASVAGTVKIDHGKLEITVNQKKRPMYAPLEGDIVEGVVTHVKAKAAMVDILRSDKKEFPVPVIGVIHISNLSNRYVEKIDYAIAEDDYIRARVTKSECDPIQLTMVDAGLGILHALCRWCGGKLIRAGRDLDCVRCGKRDTRKLANDFNTATLKALKA